MLSPIFSTVSGKTIPEAGINIRLQRSFDLLQPNFFISNTI